MVIMSAAATTAARTRRLVILYGIGGLSDVGRHAILAALEQPTVEHVTVITEYPELLDLSNWECSCPGGHSHPAKDHPDRVTVVPLWGDDDDDDKKNPRQPYSWQNPPPNLSQHFQGADAVISCLGHRQPGHLHPELIKKGLIAHDGTKQVLQAMKEANLSRIILCSSVGVEEDKPPIEFHWAGKILALMFKTNSKRAFQDLTRMEMAVKEEALWLDYVLVRPVGLGEEVVPVNQYFVQQEKGKDVLGINMAKLDCARFMVHEALNPTYHRRGVVVGSEPPPSKSKK